MINFFKCILIIVKMNIMIFLNSGINFYWLISKKSVSCDVYVYQYIPSLLKDNNNCMIREFIENLLSYLTLKVSFMTHILYLKELIEYMYIFKILVYIF